mmetsp:Transcript_32643/g.53066  ORF Transcript_32643/g.53066 Transcript_32643/m.53066 type:complete len:190 (-) Transcript_32643:118-687(-)
MRSLKCVVVGDDGVGKSSMLITLKTKAFPGLTTEIPSVYEGSTANLLVDGKTTNLCLWDTTSHEDFKHLRVISYPHTDVFLITFSITSPASFENVKTKWIPEIQQHCPHTPFILVGTKSDARNDKAQIKALESQNIEMVNNEKGEQLAKETNAKKYLECSALTQDGLMTVFDSAVRAGRKPPARDCVIL